MEGVVACVAYADGRRVRDVEIPDISDEWRYGYPGVMAGMAVICVYLYYRFKRSGWL